MMALRLALAAISLAALAFPPAVAGAQAAADSASTHPVIRLAAESRRDTGLAAGRVTDASTGAPIGGALVRIVLQGADSASRTLHTDTDGRWRATALPRGDLLVRFQAIGYAPRTIALALAPGRDATADVALVPAAVSLDQVVVTAARREQRLADVAVTTEVVSRREIEQTGAADLAAVLIEQTGIQLQGGHPTGAGLMLQGIGSERVLVLLDGQPLVGRLSGNFDIARIPTSIIERVEIVKGPQSTLYGSEAMGGVINIVTRDVPDAPWSAEARVLTGTAGRLDGDARATMTRGAFAGSLDVGRRAVERAPGVALERGALAERLDAAAKLRWEGRGTLAVEGALLALDERQRWWNGTQYSFADNVQVSGRAGAAWMLGASRVSTGVHVSHFDHLARSSAYAKPIAGTGDRQTQRLAEAELLVNGMLAGAALDLGLEAKQEFISSSDGRIAGGDRSLYSVEPFAQLEWSSAAWTIAPGARVSWNEQWGTHVSPKLALRWSAAPSLALRASAGTGFRAPDFKELYFDFTNDGAGYAVHGNPDLRPEHSRNASLGAEWNVSRVHARAQLFWNELHDFIETRPLSQTGGFTIYTYGNVDRGRTRGVELESGLVLGALRADASWAFLDARDVGTGHALLGRPRHSGRLSLAHALPVGLRASLTTTYTGRTPMQRGEDGAVTSERDAFTRVDVRVAQRLPLDLELVAGADNVFDARPRQWAESVERQLYVGLSWRAEGTRR